MWSVITCCYSTKFRWCQIVFSCFLIKHNTVLVGEISSRNANTEENHVMSTNYTEKKKCIKRTRYPLFCRLKTRLEKNCSRWSWTGWSYKNLNWELEENSIVLVLYVGRLKNYELTNCYALLKYSFLFTFLRVAKVSSILAYAVHIKSNVYCIPIENTCMCTPNTWTGGRAR